MHATINDVSGGEGDNAGYRVTAVDGKPVERASSKTQTLVPVAVIEPGTRSISLEPRYDQKLQPRTIQANFEAGKRYRLHSQNGQVAVVEETPAPQIPPASRR